jgi:hypothetical protein
MILDTITWKGHKWYLHSYVYGKATATLISARIKKTGASKLTHIKKIVPEPGERRNQYAVYWRNSK